MNAIFKFYRIWISPAFHSFSSLAGVAGSSGCRFEPTCSCYAEASLQKYGFIKGSFKTIHRISRCHPFSGDGGYDPV